ncbi:hypothetical protein Droror1_Dr00022641 [Drosera rotundifolia]
MAPRTQPVKTKPTHIDLKQKSVLICAFLSPAANETEISNHLLGKLSSFDPRAFTRTGHHRTTQHLQPQRPIRGTPKIGFNSIHSFHKLRILSNFLHPIDTGTR